MKINYEQGFFRLSLVLSVLSIVIAFLIGIDEANARYCQVKNTLDYLSSEHQWWMVWNIFVEDIVVGLVTFVTIWISYFVLKYIIKGFIKA